MGVAKAARSNTTRYGLRRVEYSTADYILKYVYDVVVKEVHVCYLIF